MDFLLFGLEPPTNIARRVRQAQESLYAAWGLVSPLALPPLVPLRFARPEAPPTAEALRGMERGLAAALRAPGAPRGPRCRTAGCTLREGVLFWEVDGELAALQALAGRVSPWPVPADPPLPAAQGFFLALPEGEVDLARAGSSLHLPPPAAFTALALVLLSVERLRPEPIPPSAEVPPSAPWFRALEWEELLRLPLRKHRPQVQQDSG